MKRLVERWQIARIRISHWEYWNSYLLYLPVLPYLFYLWLKARNAFFFNAANPGIEYGGLIMESKWKIHKSMPTGFFPDTILVNPGEDISQLIKRIDQQFTFPFILKPDTGSKGRGVAIIHNWGQLRLYHHHCPVSYLVQEKINYPMEAGIFYVRMPGESKGKITGIVEKEFIRIKGNGKLTLEQLLKQNPRYLLQVESLKRILGDDIMRSIPLNGEYITPVDIGNHARGSLFLNRSDRITDNLTAMMDQLCKPVPGFYFGRLDIRFRSWDLLERGQDFAVIEINGAGSEPTHIYDPSAKLMDAWKEICRHWKLIYHISQHNHKRGVKYLEWKEGIRLFRDNAKLDKKLRKFGRDCSLVIHHHHSRAENFCTYQSQQRPVS
jgi:hypothetical protein